jgi:cell division protein FtsB
MFRHKVTTLVLGVSLAVLSTATPVIAQTSTDQTATSPDSQTSKQAQKAQKKADRKARRTKKNAELSKLEKNGYNPSGSQTDYPQNLQNAQKKANGQ